MRKAGALAAVLSAAAAVAPCAVRAMPVLEPLLLKRGNYHESFTFIGDLDDGTYVQLSMVFSNLGPGSTKGLCRAVVIRAQGEPWKAGIRVGKDEYGWKGGDEERLDIGGCTAWSDAAGLRVQAKLEGGLVRLAFAERPGRTVGRETVVHVGKARYDTRVLLSRAAVAAAYALPGSPEQSVPGGGYVDHTRSTVFPIDLAERWVRFRALRGDRPLLVLGRLAKDGSFAPVWACGAVCRDYARFDVRRDAAARAPSFHVAVVGGDGSDAPIALDSGRLLYRDAPVEDLGVLGRVIMPFTGNPVAYVFRGRATALGAPPLEGILEVEFASD